MWGGSRCRSRTGQADLVPMSALQAMGAAEALQRVNVPSYVIDSDGVIRWVNPVAQRIVGDVKGRHFTSVVAPDHTRRARELFAQRLTGKAPVTDAALEVIDIDGNHVAVE